MKTYSDYTLNNLNKHSLVKIIKELYAMRDEAIEYIKYCQTSNKDIFPVIESEKMFEILQGNKEEE